MTQDMNQDDDTEYDEDYDDMGETTPDAEMETGNEGDDDEEYDRTPNHSHRPPHPHSNFISNANLASFQPRPSPIPTNPFLQQPDTASQRDRTIRGLPAAMSPVAVSSRLNTQANAVAAPAAPRRTVTRTFGQQPVIETSTSPTPSEVASNRSTGTNQSSGAFFRTYQEVASSSRSNGALTPELNFAEIGHGRGAGNSANAHVSFLAPGRVLEAPQAFHAIAGPSSSNHSSMPVVHSPGSLDDHQYVPMDTSTSNAPCGSADALIAWPHLRGGAEAGSLSSSPTTRELHDSVQSAFTNSTHESRETAEGRGRRVKRSLRNTINAAETFFFGRGSNNGPPDGNAGWSNAPDNGFQRH